MAGPMRRICTDIEKGIGSCEDFGAWTSKGTPLSPAALQMRIDSYVKALPGGRGALTAAEAVRVHGRRPACGHFEVLRSTRSDRAVGSSTDRPGTPEGIEQKSKSRVCQGALLIVLSNFIHISRAGLRNTWEAVFDESHACRRLRGRLGRRLANTLIGDK
jgi:hypothetical protein